MWALRHRKSAAAAASSHDSWGTQYSDKRHTVFTNFCGMTCCIHIFTAVRTSNLWDLVNLSKPLNRKFFLWLLYYALLILRISSWQHKFNCYLLLHFIIRYVSIVMCWNISLTEVYCICFITDWWLQVLWDDIAVAGFVCSTAAVVHWTYVVIWTVWCDTVHRVRRGSHPSLWVLLWQSSWRSLQYPRLLFSFKAK